MNSTITESLAIYGGTAAAPNLTAPSWPPRSADTGQRLLDTYMSGNWSFAGEHELAFAQEFANYHGAKFGIFMANGSVTLQCALQAYGIGPGDEVIVPAFTWIATAMAVLEVGAIPVMVDVEASSLCLDPALVQAAITPRTRAIIPVHIYGGMADLDAILEIAGAHNLIVIEDCAHAHGGQWKGRGLGSWGHVGSFSFQQSKTMSSGEGGICITNDEEIAARLYKLKHIGYGSFNKQGQAATGPDADLLCHNFRATEFQAVILRDQLQALPERMAAYRAGAARLEELLTGVPNIRVQARGREATAQSYYRWTLIFEDALAEVPLGDIQKALEAEGVTLGITYGPVYDHILWNAPENSYRMPAGGCAVSEDVATRRTLVLPHYWLGSDAGTIEAIGRAIAKLGYNGEVLRAAHRAGADGVE